MAILGIFGAGLIGLFIAIFIYGPILLYFFYVPTTNKLRVSEKVEGPYTYYRSEYYRPIAGWTGFNASKYNGTIWVDNSWTNNKQYCEDNIVIYKNLKNIKS